MAVREERGMIDRDMVERKLKRIEEFLRELEQARIGTFEDFAGNVMLKRFAERNIELAIEQMMDICRHLVSALDLKEPDSYAECFAIISLAGIVPAEHTATFQAMTRYRNMLIHIYDGVDDTVTYGILNKRLGDFRLFVRLIRTYIGEKQG